MRDRFEQFIGPAEQGISRFRTIATDIGRIGGNQVSLTMLAHNSSAEMLDTNLKAPAARRTLLDEVGWVGHRGTSYRQTAIQ
jgi:hypothetical protein